MLAVRWDPLARANATASEVDLDLASLSRVSGLSDDSEWSSRVRGQPIAPGGSWQEIVLKRAPGVPFTFELLRAINGVRPAPIQIPPTPAKPIPPCTVVNFNNNKCSRYVVPFDVIYQHNGGTSYVLQGVPFEAGRKFSISFLGTVDVSRGGPTPAVSSALYFRLSVGNVQDGPSNTDLPLNVIENSQNIAALDPPGRFDFARAVMKAGAKDMPPQAAFVTMVPGQIPTLVLSDAACTYHTYTQCRVFGLVGIDFVD